MKGRKTGGKAKAPTKAPKSAKPRSHGEKHRGMLERIPGDPEC